MRKTLLLVFIHGFKGGDDTFGSFPEHLRALVDHALPLLDVKAITYPKFETRGELKECVERFREWLQNKVIDLEVAHNAPSPMIDPSVHVVLIGHSMGGIVAAESLLLVASDHPIPSSVTNTTFPANATAVDSDSNPLQTSMFPQIVGLIAFDTPFLGLSPGVIAHGAEGHYRTASSAYTAFNDLSSAFGWNSPKTSPVAASAPQALPPASSAAAVDAAATPRWQSWGKYAMFAGAAGAVAAGGAAALYSQRERLSSGWGWVSGHLEFVGCLVRAEELRTRIESVARLSEVGARAHGHLDGGTGFRGALVLYTVLGRGANTAADSLSGKVVDAKRTFVKLPTSPATSGPKTIENTPEYSGSGSGLSWRSNTNDKAPDEISAHVAMFFPRDNPGFYTLGEHATEAISAWVLRNRQWYESSEPSRTDQPASSSRYSEDGPGPAVHDHDWKQHGHSTDADADPDADADAGDDGWERPTYHDQGARANPTDWGAEAGTEPATAPRPEVHNPDSHPDPDPVWVHARDLDDTDVWMRDDEGGEPEGQEAEGGKRSGGLQSSVVVEKGS